MPASFIRFYLVCRRNTWESHLEEQRRLYHQLVEEIIIANPEVQLFLASSSTYSLGSNLLSNLKILSPPGEFSSSGRSPFEPKPVQQLADFLQVCLYSSPILLSSSLHILCYSKVNTFTFPFEWRSLFKTLPRQGQRRAAAN